ncbi:MAG: hypothetical protein AB8G18_04650 [Gammaproteobacteria bacterium]
MKVLTVICALFFMAGCSTVGVDIEKVISPAHNQFGTEMQANTWKDFKKMLDRFNLIQGRDEQIICDPRKRNNGRFTYIHCEFGTKNTTYQAE